MVQGSHCSPAAAVHLAVQAQQRPTAPPRPALRSPALLRTTGTHKKVLWWVAGPVRALWGKLGITVTISRLPETAAQCREPGSCWCATGDHPGHCKTASGELGGRACLIVPYKHRVSTGRRRRERGEVSTDVGDYISLSSASESDHTVDDIGAQGPLLTCCQPHPSLASPTPARPVAF